MMKTIELWLVHEQETYIATNTQNKLEILHDSPLLTGDLVLSKIFMFAEREEIVYRLLSQLDKNG
jgi:hypothetical protein